MRSHLVLLSPVIIVCLSVGGQTICVPVTMPPVTDSPDTDLPGTEPPEQQAPSPTPGQLLEGRWSLTLDDKPDDPTFSELRLTFDDDGDATEIELRGGIIFRWSGASIIVSESEVDGSDVTFSATFTDGALSEGNLEFSGTTTDASGDIVGTVTMNLRVPRDSFNARNEPATMTPR